MKKKYLAFAFLFFVFTQGSIIAQCTGTVVPYFEDFQGITQTNQLPSCWAASSPSAACLTFTTPGNFAAFNYNPGGIEYFYSEGLHLLSGPTYSAAFLYKNDLNSGSSNLTLMFGTSQSPGGLTSISTLAGPASSTSYSLLSGTFTVPSNGLYYIAVRGSGSGTASTQYLSWDDLSITFSCSGTPPNVSMNSFGSTTTICEGQSIFLTASGADTYTWSNGSNTPSTSDAPIGAGVKLYYVYGEDAITGCIGSASQTILVLPSPTISVSSNTNNICAGQYATLTASGANTYAWSNSAVGASTTVSPNTNTSYSVIGTTSLGCAGGMNSILITVKPAPPMLISPAASTVCSGQTITLTVSGATSYLWNTGSNLPYIVVNPTANTTYTIVGTYTNACTRTQVFNLYAIPLPDIEIIASQYTICATTEIALDGSGAQTYTWTYDGNSSNDATILLNPLTTLTYTLRGTDANGCVGQETVSVFVNACIGLNGNIINEALKIFPNPTNAVFCIENAGDCTLSVYDLRGRRLFDKELKAGLPVIDISALSGGIYILRIQSTDKVEVLKIVKE